MRLVARPVVSRIGGGDPRHLCLYVLKRVGRKIEVTLKELSIFVDESGDFGELEPHSPYYLISMIFHNQKKSIQNEVEKLNSQLVALGFGPNFYIHTGPAIRREREYHYMSLGLRRKLISLLLTFFRAAPVSFEVFQIEKKDTQNSIAAVGKLSKQISEFIKEHLVDLQKYNVVKIYYDHGQSEVTKMLLAVFNSLLQNVTIKNASPKEYKLFQAADLVCTLQLAAIKSQKKSLSKSEINFFEGERGLKRDYLRKIERKRFGVK